MTAREIREQFLAEMSKHGYYEIWQNGADGPLLQGYRHATKGEQFSLGTFWSCDITRKGKNAVITISGDARRQGDKVLPPDDLRPWRANPYVAGSYFLDGEVPAGPDVGAQLVRWLARSPGHEHMLPVVGLPS